MLFSSRMMRLAPARPTSCGSSTAPVPAAAPAAKPFQKRVFAIVILPKSIGEGRHTPRLPLAADTWGEVCVQHNVSGMVKIGTSGWHYKHWCGPFYDEKLPAAKMLAEYYQHFDTVELNNSFYRLPTEDAFRCWRESTPKNFLFAVKGSRFITHMKKLKDPENALENLIPRAEQLKEKLGPILWQLPPHWTINLERLEEFLSALPKKHRYAIEFREHSWPSQRVYEIMRKHNAAFCIFEVNGRHSPLEVTADWTYVRLHGPGGAY